MTPEISPMLSFAEEQSFEERGYQRIAGVDEVGRGCLAGPVVAAAVAMPYHMNAPWFTQVNDSKLLSPLKRERLSQHIQKVALGIGVGIVAVEVIDTEGIAAATRLAMKQAVERIVPPPECLLIDYVRLPEVALPQKGIKNGDSLCFSIACASIVAKVARDRLMVELDKTYPGYGLAHHKGYGTKEHLTCLRRLGPSPIHRRTFKPVQDICQER
jgi:ribonuclease HII